MTKAPPAVRRGASCHVVMERIGFEPMTFRLQSGCSTN